MSRSDYGATASTAVDAMLRARCLAHVEAPDCDANNRWLRNDAVARH
jgi:hypothetical protein